MSFNKPYLLSLIFITLAVGHSNAQTEKLPYHTSWPRHTVDTIKLLDSLYQYFWRTNIGYWVNEDLDLFSYDHNTDMTKWNRKHWDESYGYLWYDDFRVLYTLEGRLPMEELKQNYDLQKSQWINYTLFSYVYDGQGNKTEWKWQKWSAELNEWTNFRLNQYFYDEYSQLIQSVSSTWDAVDSVWILSQKTEISYDSAGADTLILTSFWSAIDSVWIYLSLKRNFYDQAGNRVGEQMQSWDAGSSAWINSGKNLSVYNEYNKPLLTIYQHWDSDVNAWIDRNRTEYSYNETGLLSHYITSDWDLSNLVWSPASRGMYEYDRDGDVVDFILQDWDQQAVWINKSRKHYVYFKVLSLEETGSPSAISCFRTGCPTGYRCLKCNGLNKDQSYSLSVYSMQGSCILDRIIRGDQAVSLQESIPPGVYILTITGRDRLFHSEKIMIP